MQGPLRVHSRSTVVEWTVALRRKMCASGALVVRGADDAGAAVEGTRDAEGTGVHGALVLRGDKQVARMHHSALFRLCVLSDIHTILSDH